MNSGECSKVVVLHLTHKQLKNTQVQVVLATPGFECGSRGPKLTLENKKKIMIEH